MDAVKTLLEGKVDYQGQRLADRINQELIVIGAAVCLLLGFALSSLQVMFVGLGVVAVVDFLIVVPAWPIYNKYETKWLPSRPPSATEDKAKTQ